MQDPQFIASLQKVGSSAQPKERATPEAHAAYLRQEINRWGPILKAANIRGN